MAAKPHDKGVARPVLYRDKLDPPEKSRYIEKLKLIDGEDPLDDSVTQQWTKSCENILPSVSQYDILYYLMFNPSGYTQEQLKSLKGLDAYNQFVCGWVSDRRAYVCADNKHVAVTAKVMHSQKLREKPLRPWVLAEKEGVVVCSHCDCQAGLGEVCTHVSALLFSIEAVARIRDERTVTDKPAYWKLPAELKKVEFSRLCEIDMSSVRGKKRQFDSKLQQTVAKTTAPRPKDVEPPSESGLKAFYDELFNTGTKPVLLSTVSPYCASYIPRVVTEEFPKSFDCLYVPHLLSASKDDVLKHCESVIEGLNVTEEQAKNVEMATRQQSKCKLWNKFRTGRVTASKASAVLKTNTASPAPSLVKAICYPDLMKFKTESTQWGLDHEEVAKKEFVDQMKPFHENFSAEACGFSIDPKHYYIGATPDAVISCDCCGSFLLEIKCPSSARNNSVYKCTDYLEKNDEGKFHLKKDHPYYYQIQTQLGVTGKDVCFFVVWTTKDSHVERIVFDESVYSDICDKAKVLFHSAILPELVAKVTTRKHVLQLSVQNDTNTAASTVEPSDSVDKWCTCREGEHGRMIACDNENCSIQWYHIDCVGLKKVPRGTWFCKNCKS